MSATKLFLRPTPNPAAALQLFCFPFAGGSAATYRPWLNHLHRDIELIAVQLPGRGSLLDAPPYDNMQELAAALCAQIKDHIDGPYIFFGHSLGSKIAFELACELQRQRCPLPRHFFASGAGAPFKPRRAAPIHTLPDAEFMRRVGALNGTPAKVLQNKELMQFMLPMLRADFKLVETYLGNRDCVLPTALTILGGDRDAAVAREDLLAWQEVFCGRIDVKIFAGGHFFINQYTAEIAASINALMPGRADRGDSRAAFAL